MSMLGETENTEASIVRLKVKLSDPKLTEQQRKPIERDLAYEIVRLEALQKLTNKEVAQ